MIRNLIGIIPAHRYGLVWDYFGLTLISVGLRAASCLLLVPLVGALFGPTPAQALPSLGALTAVIAIAWAVDTLLSRIGFSIGFELLNSTQHELADRLTRIPLSWFTTEHTATARQAITSGGPELVGLIANLLTPFLGAVLLPAAIAIGLFLISWQLGVAAIVTLPVLLAALAGSSRIARAADAADARAHQQLTERILEFARTQQALRASRRAEPARSQTGQAIAAQHGATMRLLLFQIPGQLLFSIASQIALILLAGTTILLTLHGGLTAPQGVALVVVVVRFLEPFTALADLGPAVENARGGLERLGSVLSAPTDTDPTETIAANPPSTPPRVEFRDVHFSYGHDPDSTEVLTGLSFVLEPATTTAIVGPSGSGKSTILSLIAGLHKPDRGQILLDGTDITECDQASQRALVSMVFQHPYLFDGSIRGNVLVGRPSADDDELSQAVRLARVDEILRRLPDGDQARVGEAGTALSGGERQRVSIARALLKPAPTLLIDEATSALDTENENAVIEALTGDSRSRTRVVVAHRLNAIRAADRVLFIQDGALAEDGTIGTLIAHGGRFAQFWRQQQEIGSWRISGSQPSDSQP